MPHTASHIKPWRKCSNKERLDPQNGLLLTARINALFDCGLISNDVNADNTYQLDYRQFWLILDPTLRVRHVVPFAQDGSDTAAFFKHLACLPPPNCFAGIELQAPILYLPDVFGPAFCSHLIDRYRSNGGREFGMMREVGGKAVEFQNPAFGAYQTDRCAYPAPPCSRNTEKLLLRPNPNGATRRWLLFRRGRGAFLRAQRQYHTGHLSSSLRRFHQLEFGF